MYQLRSSFELRALRAQGWVPCSQKGTSHLERVPSHLYVLCALTQEKCTEGVGNWLTDWWMDGWMESEAWTTWSVDPLQLLFLYILWFCNLCVCWQWFISWLLDTVSVRTAESLYNTSFHKQTSVSSRDYSSRAKILEKFKVLKHYTKKVN